MFETIQINWQEVFEEWKKRCLLKTGNETIFPKRITEIDVERAGLNWHSQYYAFWEDEKIEKYFNYVDEYSGGATHFFVTKAGIQTTVNLLWDSMDDEEMLAAVWIGGVLWTAAQNTPEE